MTDPTTAEDRTARLTEIRSRAESWREIYDVQPQELMDIDVLLSELEAAQARLDKVSAVADRIEPHANNMAAMGELEISVPLKAAVRDIRAALGLGEEGTYER